ncbi:LysR substrate-binding domain-containing protein [Ruegeria meonggei]|uniref:Glycine cleavage system transcriptional activator n=1 Tax=Ruegeria meonggei TaxID=1446476 RepID=A0A1X7A1M5_9RHOB|nr:LysR substrate-binding domain-containing protein [Ruegeria meonggei]SLN67483.1 Glycine cleavage system transcriptional activator [Ruegeria meonggei]
MPAKPINLTWLRSFEAAARHMNFTDASVELGLTQTAVSLHIRSLEQQINNNLFHRRARHLTLTELGQAYATTVRQAFADIDLVSASLFGPIAARTITIKAPISTAALWLSPRLPEFRQEHPGIDLRVVTNIWTEATNLEGVDVELRLGRGDWTDAQSEKLSDETIIPICAANSKKKVRQAKDFLHGPLIHILGHEGNWERYFGANGCSMLPEVPQYFMDTTISALQLVASGGGYATVLSRLVEKQGGLTSGITPVGRPIPFPDAHYLMRRPSKRVTRPEVDLFEAWLRDQFASGNVS